MTTYTFSYDERTGLLNVGDRAYPVAKTVYADVVMPSGWTMRTRVHRLALETGYGLSIVWSSLTYSSNHDADPIGGDGFTEEPELVEIAVAAPDGGLVDCFDDGQDVRGWCSTEFVNELIGKMNRGWPTAGMVQ